MKTIKQLIDENAPQRASAKEAIEHVIEMNRLHLTDDPDYGVILEGMTVARYMPWRLGNGYHTALSDDRFHIIQQLEASAPGGTAIEMGVFTGGVTKFFLDCNRPTLAFDTFEGIAGADPENDLHVDGEYNGGTFIVDGIEMSVLDYIAGAIIVKGKIPDTLEDLKVGDIAIAHIDLDVYEPTVHALKFVYKNLLPDGVMIIDDYGFASTPGVKRAVDEFQLGRKLYIPTGQMIIWRD